jgi:hypothetical protein
MSTGQVKSELSGLLKEQRELFKLVQTKGNKLSEFGPRYETWYARAVKLVELLGPDRLEEFVGHYRIDPSRQAVSAATFVIQDLIDGGAEQAGGKQWDASRVALARIFGQFQILTAIAERADSVLSDLGDRVLADLLGEELRTAGKLVKVNRRSAGVLAGLVLEKHLLKMGRSRKIPEVEKGLALSDCNDLFKDKGIYKVTTWKEIQSLAEIYNACAEQRISTPSEQQVIKLVEGVGAILKSVS